MATQEIHAEQLLGRHVRAINGRVVGRLQEIRVQKQTRGWYVEEFLTGDYSLLDRLAGWTIGRAVLRIFGASNKTPSYRIPWDKLDLTDPQRPRLRCDVAELSPVQIEE